MKKTKTGILIAIMVFMTMLLLVACGGNGNDNNDNNANVTPPPANNDPAPDPTPTPAGNDEPTPVIEPEQPRGIIHEPKDMGGRTVRFSSWFEGSQNFVAFGNEPDPATASNYFIERLIWDNARRVEQEFNVNFSETIVDFGYVISTLTASVMAGEPNADFTFIDGGMTLTAALGNLILPLDEINLPNSDIFGPRIYGSPRIDQLGHVWTVGPNEPDPGGMGMGVNLDIINAIGAQNPVDLYNRGQWNWTNALEIMRMATRDTTGDGINDQWGLAGQPGDFVTYFIGGNDGILVTEDFQFGMDHPNTIEALEFVETIFREGLWEFDPVLGADPGDWGRNFWAAHDGNSALFTASYWTLNDGDLPFEFALVPFPTGPSNTSGNTFMGGWRQGFGIPAGTDWDPADLLIIFEELIAWPGDEPGLLHEEVLDMLRGTFLTEEDAQRQLNMINSMAMEMGKVVPQYHWVLGDFVGYFVNQEMTVLQAIEAHRGPQQELLDNFFR